MRLEQFIRRVRIRASAEDGRFVRRKLDRLFRYRHRVTVDALQDRLRPRLDQTGSGYVLTTEAAWEGEL